MTKTKSRHSNLFCILFSLQELDYEVELAFIIGKTGKNIKVHLHGMH
jgi:2-keto-4-pentenoate hydratase/2-oxohepta-3-ene-1,7-dioic acid hydratase in catechol pathway